MKVELNHNLPKEKAVLCAEKIFKQLSEKHKDEFSDLEQKTLDNKIMFSLKVKGMSISGTITVNDNDVIIESKLPFLARMFEGKIETMIKENADKMMADC